MEKKKEMNIKVKCTDEIMKGVYSNNHLVHINRDECVLDFLNVIIPHATLGARVIITPGHFKRLTGAMNKTLKKYEAEFGEIEVQRSKTPTPDMYQ